MAGGNQKVELDSKKCVFCFSSENDWLQLGPKKDLENVVTHYYCLLLSSEMEQKGADSDGILGFLLPDIKKELNRGKRLKCTHCNQNGATIRCIVSKCKKNFHLPCGIKNNSLHQFHGHFKSFCGAHRPVQKIPANLLAELAAGLPCGVCLEELPKFMGGDTVWAPCCRKGAWFHRQCVQRLAISAGYFFKCPLCNDKEKFNKTMLDCGIFIPEQDASWETEPNAFEDLLHRHSSCDHPACRDPMGRTNNVRGTRWEVILCDMCGSQGVHMACGQLSWSKPEFECDICKGSRVNAAVRDRPSASTTEDTDSDSSEQESRPFSPPTSPLLNIRVDSPDPFVPVKTRVPAPFAPPPIREEGTTPPRPSTMPSMSGPFPPQPTRRRAPRGRPPLKKIQPVAHPPPLLPAQPTTQSPVVYPTENVFIALQQPEAPPKYNLYDPDPASASASSLHSEFTVVGGHIFQPKPFSESVSITPPPPPVRVLNQSPTKVSTTVRSTLFPQSQSRVVPTRNSTEIIYVIDDSDEEIEIVEDKHSSRKELVTNDGAKIPVVNLPVTTNFIATRATDSASPDIEIIEESIAPPPKPKTMYVRRKTTSARSQENLSPLRLALELPLAPGQTAVPEVQTKPAYSRMIAPRRVREMPSASQSADQTTRSRNPVRSEWNTSTANDNHEAAALPNRQASVNKNGTTFVATSTLTQEVLNVNVPDNRQGNWEVQTTQLQKRIRLQGPNNVSTMAASSRPSRDPPSYEETMKNDKSQVRYLPAPGNSAEAAGGSAASRPYFIAESTANFGNLLDGTNLFTLSRTSADPSVSSFMLTPVGSAYIRPGVGQTAMSVGGNDPSSQRRRLECDPGSGASSNVNSPSRQTTSAACARSERQAIGEARQASASKAVGSADLPGCDHNRLINLRTVSFKLTQPDLVKMTDNLKENLIQLTTPDKKILIPVKPTVYCDESEIALKVVPPKPELQRAKRGAAFLRSNDTTKSRKRRGRSFWSQGLIKPQKKRVKNDLNTTPSTLGTTALSAIDAIPSSSSSLCAAEGLPFMNKTLDTGCSLATESGTPASVITPTARKSSLPKRTPAPKKSPATQNSPATRRSTATDCLAKISVKKQLFAPEKHCLSSQSPEKKSLEVANPKERLFTSESPGKSDIVQQAVSSNYDIIGTPESQTPNQNMSSSNKKAQQKKSNANATSARGQCLTRRTRSVMKAASYSTRSKVSLQRYNFKEGSDDYVPLLRKGYIPKKMQTAGISPKVSTVTSATLNIKANVSPSLNTDEFPVIDSNCQKSEVESHEKEGSFSDSFVSCNTKLTESDNCNANISDSGQSGLEKGSEAATKENLCDDLISDDEDFLSSQDEADDIDIDDEDDSVFIKRTMKEYKKINQISTLKAKALTARKFRPASDTEKMQREMLLKLREKTSTILHPDCDL